MMKVAENLENMAKNAFTLPLEHPQSGQAVASQVMADLVQWRGRYSFQTDSCQCGY